MGEFQRWNTHHSHVVPIEVCGTQLNIAQDPNSDNLGTTIWDASVILVRYMERNPQLYSRRRLEGKRVLELGAGCGLAGMYFALQGAHVTFTDLIEVVPLLHRNVTMNLGGQAVEAAAAGTTAASDLREARGRGGKSVAAAAPARPKAQVLEYDWGKPLDGLSPPYDYIVACDCVYVERLVESLVWSMARCSDRGTTVLVASEKREEVTYAKFRARLSEDFAVRQAPRRHMDKAYDHENSEVLLCKLRRTNSSSSSSANGRGCGGEDQQPGGERGKEQEIGSNAAAAAAAAAITEEASKKEGGYACCCSPGREATPGKAAVTRAGGDAEDDALGAEESIAVAGNAPTVTVPRAPPPSGATADVVEGLSLAAVSLAPPPLSSLETAAGGEKSRGPAGQASSTAVGGSRDPPLR
ncbi:unnamed protein product [Ectocarpus sp. CCAP 1310/34]|nr:unnamed protein product [Ectocarpus sp. CCAP 1310/34]